ncbi:tRNA(Met) cytidine acetyltransferase TmcA [Marinobacter mobilis]|uniref:tRNA(Met) cytidine acetyltransferase TmcA n=3 Tax=Marinobacter mobilis TaxID=488533 RepID=A0A1H2PZ86_9GAMM|nr:GNAT family N-acetyltransferase [Marinobacter mobilis]SDW00182.1 tRNA(Met)-cytidine N(4)-acetyltransferase [Marinobacter mobilis]
MNHTAEAARWAHFQRQLRQAGQRRMVLVEGERAQCLAWLRPVLAALSGGVRLWIGQHQDPVAADLVAVSASKARQWLGRDTDVLVWDGWSGNPPDSLAAFGGTLNAGGLWFWLMPPLAQWPAFADPDYGRTGLADAPEHAFARRLATLIARDADVIRVNADTDPSYSLPELTPRIPPFSPAATAEQQQLVEAIVRTGQGRRRRPLVVTADRGRGKSAALGMAAVQLLQAGRSQVVVTAPSPDAVATLFHHARAAAGEDALAATGSNELVLREGGTLRFWALDELLQQRPSAELVLVDEAAAIPASQLREVLLGWPRCVFASTVHGYEGAGRGFAIRFRAELQQHTPQWQAISLSAPIRWGPGDPLERLTAELFLLNASASAGAATGELTLEPWRPASASDSELKAAFGLLIDAHYRTTPGDLRQWLDDPAAVSWRVVCNGELVAVLWATVEGGLPIDLAQAVAAGQRRLRGHLLPQSLANHSGFAEAACLRLLRVVRVAVRDDCRRRGLGQKLVAAAGDHARAAGLDAIGTSYGASEELLAFWQNCHLPLVRLGLQREASSGEYTVQRLLGLSAAGVDLQWRIGRRFSEHWPVLVPAVWPQLAPPLVLAVMAQLTPGPDLSEQDRIELFAFAEGCRGFELTLPVLRRFSACAGVAVAISGKPAAALWCRGVVQGWSWAQLQAAGDCQGRRHGEQLLRALVRETLELVNRSM